MDPLQQAHALAQTGDLEGAARMCRAVLAREPRHDYALFMLGSIEGQLGRLDEAAQLLGQAVRINPRSPDAQTSYGRILADQKKHAEAIEALNKALMLRPQNPIALIARGRALAEAGRREEALRDFDRALALDPRSVFALHNRAHLLIEMKRQSEARASIDALLAIAPGYVPGICGRVTLLVGEKRLEAALAEADRGLALEPESPDLWNLRGSVLYQLKRYDDALANYAKAIQLRPGCADFHLNRGNLLMDLERYDAARESFERAAALDPRSAEAHLQCANALMEEMRLDEALSRCDRAIAAEPGYASAHVLRGNILLHLGRRKESLASYDAAIATSPDYADAHYNRGSALLLEGRFEEGFADFEYRWKAQDCGFDRPELAAPEWRGEAVEGKSIVVYSEQGLGDTIHFARFLPRLARMGAKLTFLCHPNLIRLFKPLAQEMELIAYTGADRRFDFQCALMSLPHRLGIGLASLPNEVPYVFAEEPLVERWRETLGARGFKVGIGWQGNPKGKVDKGRSLPLAVFAPLSRVPGVRLISLQKKHGLDQLERLPQGMAVETLGEFDAGEDAFVDTAAIVQNLDLVVVSDSATAHLAGAMGVPTWVALKHVPDWRWMLDRADSPWYPSLRLFRQRAPGGWEGVFGRIAGALRSLVEAKAPLEGKA